MNDATTPALSTQEAAITARAAVYDESLHPKKLQHCMADLDAAIRVIRGRYLLRPRPHEVARAATTAIDLESRVGNSPTRDADFDTLVGRTAAQQRNHHSTN